MRSKKIAVRSFGQSSEREDKRERVEKLRQEENRKTVELGLGVICHTIIISCKDKFAPMKSSWHQHLTNNSNGKVVKCYFFIVNVVKFYTSIIHVAVCYFAILGAVKG